MPRYFFHLTNGTDTLLDAEGTELDGADAARGAALVEATNIISHDALKGIINLAQRIDVFDESDALVCSLKFSDAVEIRR